MPIRQQPALLSLNPASYGLSGIRSLLGEHEGLWVWGSSLWCNYIHHLPTVMLNQNLLLIESSCWSIANFFGNGTKFPPWKMRLKQLTTFLCGEFTCAVLPLELCWLPDCSHIRQGPIDFLGLVRFLPNQAPWSDWRDFWVQSLRKQASVLYG